MKLFESLYDRVIGWSRHPRAPLFLGGISFAESSFFPIPPDVMLVPMCMARPKAWWRLALLTTLTSVAGGILGYFLGLWFVDVVMPYALNLGLGPKLELVRRWFADWGFWAVILAGFSPIPYKAFTLAAGAMGMPFLPFVLASFVGRGGRFFLVAWLMGRFGPTLEPRLRPLMEWLGWGMVALVAAYALLRG